MNEELSARCLVKRLCDSIASNAFLDPGLASRLSARLFDTAFTALIGLDPELDLPYVAPEDRAAVAAAGLDQACRDLTATSYSELASSLRQLADSLHRLDSAAVLGTKAEELSGVPLALPLTEQDVLLSFLLALQGSQLSVRRRQLTCQTTHEATTAHVAAPLGFSVFSEMPDPYALTDVSSTVALLPSELGYPTHPFAAASDVQDLSAGMSSRPVWNPTATAHAPKPPSAVWLPVPGPLVEMHSDKRKGRRPPPLGLPWSLLSMGLPPGANTAFQALVEPTEDDSHLLSAMNGAASTAPWAHGAAAAAAEEGSAAEVEEEGGTCRLWSLEEADLARDAMLALQGVHSALMRLQGALAVPHALPRLSLTGVLSRVAEAAELRQRLQLFVDIHLSSPAASSTDGFPGLDGASSQASAPSAAAAATLPGGPTDPVLRAFAAAVGEVLRRQAAALQALQREGSVTWVRSVRVGGQLGRQLHSRGLTPLQVAAHTSRLKAQLQSLASLCWCLPQQQQSTAGEEGGVADPPASSRANDSCAHASLQQWGSYPRGAELLSFLYQALLEADDSELQTHRFLFAAAIAPYLAHLRSWAFTSTSLAPEFATWAEDTVAPCLDFQPPEATGAEARHGRLAVPCDPPSFLHPLHTAFMRAGTQLRLLASLPQQGRQLVAQLASIAEQEAQQLLLLGPAASQRTGVRGRGALAAGAVGLSPLLRLPGEQELGMDGAYDRGLLGDESGDEEGSWMQLDGAGAAREQMEAGLLLTSSELQQVAEGAEQADAARLRAVDSWLGDLAQQRHEAERAAAAEALFRTATMKELQSEAAARQAQLVARRHATKASLLRQQSEELAVQRARAAMQRTRQLAEERELLSQIALREHAEAVEELATALAASSFDPNGAALAAVTPAAATVGANAAATEVVAGSEKAPAGEPRPAVAAGNAPAATRQELPAAVAPAMLAEHAERAAGSAAAMALPGRAVAAAQAADANAGTACHAAALEAEPAAPGAAAEPPAGAAASPARQERGRWQRIDTALGSKAAPVLPALAAFRPAGQQLREHETKQAAAAAMGEEGLATERPAPQAAVLETCVAQSVLSQYRAVSRACVRLFLDDLRLLDHMEAMRRLFFMGAGDWAEALVSALAAHADSLELLSQHALERLLQGAVRGTSLEQDPLASRLRVRLLPGLSIVSAQVQAVALPTPRRGHTRPRVPAASVVIPPNSVDGLDCIMLDYHIGWPLSAVITEDIMQGYAAVFSLLVRVKRVELLLRSLYAPLMLQPKSTPEMLLSEEEEDRVYRRLQQLRGFRHGAAQLVAAVQAFVQSRISGEGWAQLLAALMVSSEQVAQHVLRRGPSAVLTSALSRMSSITGSGSTAHRLLRLAKTLTTRGSLSSASSPQPGTPSSATATAAQAFEAATDVAWAAAAAAAAAPGGPIPSRLGPLRSNSTAAALHPRAAEEVVAQPSAGEPSAIQSASDASMGTWARSEQQRQRQQRGEEEGGIADLQELLNLHRAYIRGASADCLTFGGSPAAREGVDAALQATMDWAQRLQAAVRLGVAGRAEGAWVQVLRQDSTWHPLAESMVAFDARLAALHTVLEGAGGRGVLAELALQLDFSGFYARWLARQQQQQQEARQPRQRQPVGS